MTDTQIRDYVDSAVNGEFSTGQKSVIVRVIRDYLAIQAGNQYREASLRLLHVLIMIDSAMSSSRDPAREWRAIALGLGLPSVCFSGLSQAELARIYDRSKMAISLQIKKFLDGSGFEPAFGTGRYPGWRNQKSNNCGSFLPKGTSTGGSQI